MTPTGILNTLWTILCEMSPYILLGFIIAGVLQVFVPAHTMSKHLSGKGIGPVFKAALFGIPLPLCSCGVLPAAVSLRRRGASKAATTSFLIATPQTGVDSIAATYSLLGLPFAIIRPVAALAGAVAGGTAVAVLDKEVDSEGSLSLAQSSVQTDYSGMPFWRRVLESIRYGLIDMVASVGPWLVTGLIVAALITMFVPESLFTSLNRYPLLAMLAVVAVAVPMYVCATGSIPIALSLMMKGLSPSIAFVLLMAGPAANFASIMVLSKTQGTKATAIYVSSVVVTAIAFGLIIDTFLPASWFAVAGASGVHDECCKAAPGLFPTICSIVLAGLIIFTFLSGKIKNRNLNESINQNDTNMTQTFHVTGMACAHCKANVEKAIAALPGVEHVEVDLDKATATVSGDVSAAAILEAVRLAGYDAK